MGFWRLFLVWFVLAIHLVEKGKTASAGKFSASASRGSVADIIAGVLSVAASVAGFSASSDLTVSSVTPEMKILEKAVMNLKVEADKIKDTNMKTIVQKLLRDLKINIQLYETKVALKSNGLQEITPVEALKWANLLKSIGDGISSLSKGFNAAALAQSILDVAAKTAPLLLGGPGIIVGGLCSFMGQMIGLFISTPKTDVQAQMLNQIKILFAKQEEHRKWEEIQTKMDVFLNLLKEDQIKLTVSFKHLNENTQPWIENRKNLDTEIKLYYGDNQNKLFALLDGSNGYLKNRPMYGANAAQLYGEERHERFETWIESLLSYSLVKDMHRMVIMQMYQIVTKGGPEPLDDKAETYKALYEDSIQNQKTLLVGFLSSPITMPAIVYAIPHFLRWCDRSTLISSNIGYKGQQVYDVLKMVDEDDDLECRNKLFPSISPKDPGFSNPGNDKICTFKTADGKYLFMDSDVEKTIRSKASVDNSAKFYGFYPDPQFPDIGGYMGATIANLETKRILGSEVYKSDLYQLNPASFVLSQYCGCTIKFLYPDSLTHIEHTVEGKIEDEWHLNGVSCELDQRKDGGTTRIDVVSDSREKHCKSTSASVGFVASASIGIGISASIGFQDENINLYRPRPAFIMIDSDKNQYMISSSLQDRYNPNKANQGVDIFYWYAAEDGTVKGSPFPMNGKSVFTIECGN